MGIRTATANILELSGSATILDIAGLPRFAKIGAALFPGEILLCEAKSELTVIYQSGESKSLSENTRLEFPFLRPTRRRLGHDTSELLALYPIALEIKENKIIEFSTPLRLEADSITEIKQSDLENDIEKQNLDISTATEQHELNVLAVEGEILNSKLSNEIKAIEKTNTDNESSEASPNNQLSSEAIENNEYQNRKAELIKQISSLEQALANIIDKSESTTTTHQRIEENTESILSPAEDFSEDNKFANLKLNEQAEKTAVKDISHLQLSPITISKNILDEKLAKHLKLIGIEKGSTFIPYEGGIGENIFCDDGIFMLRDDGNYLFQFFANSKVLLTNASTIQAFTYTVENYQGTRATNNLYLTLCGDSEPVNSQNLAENGSIHAANVNIELIEESNTSAIENNEFNFTNQENSDNSQLFNQFQSDNSQLFNQSQSEILINDITEFNDIKLNDNFSLNNDKQNTQPPSKIKLPSPIIDLAISNMAAFSEINEYNVAAKYEDTNESALTENYNIENYHSESKDNFDLNTSSNNNLANDLSSQISDFAPINPEPFDNEKLNNDLVLDSDTDSDTTKQNHQDTILTNDEQLLNTSSDSNESNNSEDIPELNFEVTQSDNSINSPWLNLASTFAAVFPEDNEYAAFPEDNGYLVSEINNITQTSEINSQDAASPAYDMTKSVAISNLKTGDYHYNEDDNTLTMVGKNSSVLIYNLDNASYKYLLRHPGKTNYADQFDIDLEGNDGFSQNLNFSFYVADHGIIDNNADGKIIPFVLSNRKNTKN